MKVGTVLSRVTVSPSFLAFFCAYYYFDPGGTFWPFFCGACAHEAGHLLLLKILKVPVHQLRLGASGACLQTGAMPYRQEILVALAGPALNLLLAAYFLYRAPMTALINLVLTLFNLLPFYPLDGGRILRCLLRLLLKEGRTAQVAERIIRSLCLFAFWGCGIYMTCCLHEGLWPVLLCALLTVRITDTIFPLYRNFANKRIDKSRYAC